MANSGNYSPEQSWSGRELEVLRLLEGGLSNREIAQQLILSPETVKWYNKQIFGKLGVNSRGQAAARARELGLLEQFRRSGTVQGVASSLWNVAGPLTKLGQAVKAARLLGAADALLVYIGAGNQPTDVDQLMKYTAETQAELGAAAFQDAWDEGQSLTLEQATALALEK